MSSHRRLIPFLAALVIVLAMASPALAAKWDFAFTQSGLSGSAQAAFLCTDNNDGTETCSSASIFVFVGRSKAMGGASEHVHEVCYSEFEDVVDSETGEPIDSSNRAGCVRDAAETLTIDDLDSITLEATEIALTTFVCDGDECTEEPAGTAVVTGEWTGIGPIVRQRSSSRFDDGICVSMDSNRGNSRQADFTGTVDSEPFEVEFADIFDGAFAFRFGCVGDEV